MEGSRGLGDQAGICSWSQLYPHCSCPVDVEEEVLGTCPTGDAGGCRGEQLGSGTGS